MYAQSDQSLYCSGILSMTEHEDDDSDQNVNGNVTAYTRDILSKYKASYFLIAVGLYNLHQILKPKILTLYLGTTNSYSRKHFQILLPQAIRGSIS